MRHPAWAWAAGDLVDLDVERGVLARQLRRVGGGEGHMDISLLACTGAGHLLLKAGDEIAAAQQQGIALTLAALEGHTVHEASKSSTTSSPMAARSGCSSVMWARAYSSSAAWCPPRTAPPGVHGAEALVLAQLYLGVQVDESGKGEAIRANVLHRQGGGAGDGDVLLSDGIHQRLGIRLVDGLLIQEIAAVDGLDLLTGGFALHGAQGLDAVVAVHQRVLPCAAVHGYGQAHLTVFRNVLAFLISMGGPPSFGKSCLLSSVYYTRRRMASLSGTSKRMPEL